LSGGAPSPDLEGKKEERRHMWEMEGEPLGPKLAKTGADLLFALIQSPTPQDDGS